MKIRAIPTESVGQIKFGMSRSEVRTAVGKAFSEFRKSKFSANTADDFGYMHVFYDAKDNCEAVEVFDDCIIEVDGVCLIPCGKAAADEWLKARDAAAEISPDNSTSNALSIGIGASDGKVESILFGRADYYA